MMASGADPLLAFFCERLYHAGGTECLPFGQPNCRFEMHKGGYEIQCHQDPEDKRWPAALVP